MAATGNTNLPPGTSNANIQLHFRPEIDVLRAVAVLSVLGFHWDIAPFRGGFVGVDVFFVISGFLITQILMKQITAGEFSFLRFYERRARRILPALYVMVMAVAVAAWFLLLPPQAIDLARSIVAVTFFGSNILFWQEAGYFDGPALAKPLLHTWSLAVEEQFYLVFPVLLLALCHRRKPAATAPYVTAGLAIIAAISFGYGVWQLSVAPSSAFYLSPGRAWEFLLGAILAVGSIPTIRNPSLAFAVATAGALMLLAAIFRFNPATPFPGTAALLPCLGAALCIWANTNREPGPVERALTRLPLLYGKISYSVYLWHWPIWVFAKLALHPSGDFSYLVKLAMFALTTALSVVSYLHVEQPFRNPREMGRRPLLVWGGAVSLLLLSFGIGGVVLNGFPSRLSPEVAALSDYANYPRSVPYRETLCFLQPAQSIQEFNVKECATAKPNMRNVLLLGDSLAAHYLPGLRRAVAGHAVSIMQANSAACPPFFGFSEPLLPNCEAMNSLVRNVLHTAPPDVVVISANWTYYSDALGYGRFLELLRQTINDANGDTPIILMGPSIQYDEPLPGLLAAMALRAADISLPAKLATPAIFALDQRMKADFSGMPNVTFVSVLTGNCPDHACPVMIGGVPTEWDVIHLTVPGSEHVIAAVMPQLGPVLFGEKSRAQGSAPPAL